MSKEDTLTVFLVTDVNTDKLPVRFRISPEFIDCEPGSSHEVVLSIYNPLDVLQTFTLAAKSTPSEASSYLHYDLIGEVATVEVVPKGSATLTYTLHVSEHVPASIGNITVAHFLYGKQAPENWRKMMAGWPNNQ